MDDLQEKLSTLNGWSFESEENRIEKIFTFKSFSEAWGFMTRAALAIEVINHHPDWRNSYNKVFVNLTTHDAGGVTQKDFDLAHILDDLYE